MASAAALVIGLLEASVVGLLLRRRAVLTAALLVVPALVVNLWATVGAPGVQKAVWAMPGGRYAVVQAPIPRAFVPGTAVVKVAYAAINPVDVKLFKHLPSVPFLRWFAPSGFTHDVSGEVVDSWCSELKVGDKVYGFGLSGSLSEYSFTPCMALGLVPPGVTLDKAAALPVAVASAHVALASKVKKGDVVLVFGALGGCGSVGVGLAKSLGASKVACVASEKNRETGLSSAVGCDVFYAYDAKDFPAKLEKELGKSVDVIYDTVSGPMASDPNYSDVSYKVLKPTGVIRALLPVSPLETFFPPPQREKITGLMHRSMFDDLGAHHVKVLKSVLVSQVLNAFDLDDVEKAVEAMHSHRARGKTVLKIA